MLSIGEGVNAHSGRGQMSPVLETCGIDAVGPRKWELHFLGREAEGCSNMILTDRSCQENVSR